MNDSNPANDARIASALEGKSLYGNDFSPSEIREWFDDEREGYFNIYYGQGNKPEESVGQYCYSALAQRHGYRWLPDREWRHVLGIGSSTGTELIPILHRSARVTILEPASGFATASIAGKPVHYIEPDASGMMPFQGDSFDLIVCFNSLHHVPNVATVLRELGRVLEPGGYALLREPIHSMGDWRKPRRGLTRRERGIPLQIFRRMLREAALDVVRETRCMFSLTSRLQLLTNRPLWALESVTAADEWICRSMLWPTAYHARCWIQKLRPTAVAYVVRRRED